MILDASQSAGILPLDVGALGLAYAAMPGHKGLYGPQGTGLLLCGTGASPRTLLEGGTGSVSLQQEMPDFLPDRLEAGTHNMPGIAGLLEGIRFVRSRGESAICAGEQALARMTADGLRELPGVRVYAAEDPRTQAGVVSFTADGWDAERIGTALAERDAAVRAGLHCAPLAHRTAGTLPGGTVRLSFSAFNRPEEVREFLALLREILREGPEILNLL